MKRKKTIEVLLLTVILWCTNGCRNIEDIKAIREKTSKKARGKIRIGAVASWEIEKNEFSFEALQLAVDEINGRGGIKGRQLEIEKEDDLGSLDQGLRQAEKFCANPEIFAVMGHSSSSISTPCSILYQYYGLPLLSPTSDDPDLSQRKGFDYIVQPNPTIREYVSELVDFLTKTPIGNVVVFNQNDTFGTKYADYFEKIASTRGINIISRIPFSEAAPEIFFKNKLLACKYFYDFDGLLIAGDSVSAEKLIDLCSKYKMNVVLLGTEKFDTKEIMAKVAETKEKVIFPVSFCSNDREPQAIRFVQSFRKKFKMRPRSRAANWYNGMHFLANAMEKSEALTPQAIINSIKMVKSWEGVLGRIMYENAEIIKITEAKVEICTIDYKGDVQYCNPADITDGNGKD